MFSRHVSSRLGRSDITRNEEQKFSHEEKNARELAARTSATTVRFPLSTPTYVSRIIYMEMRICIDFTSKPVTEPASVIDCPATWRRSSFLPCRKPEGGPPSLPLACNHRLLSVTVQTSTNVNFSSCVHRSSKRRNDTRSLFPFLFLFFFFVSSFWREEGCDIVPSFRRAKQKDGREDGDFDVNETKRAANKSSFSPLPLPPFLLIPLFFPRKRHRKEKQFQPRPDATA